jgi:signal transduction histidine kinase
MPIKHFRYPKKLAIKEVKPRLIMGWGTTPKEFRHIVMLWSIIQVYKSLGVVYSNIAIVYKMTGNYENAMEYNFKALRIKEKVNNKFDIADSYNNIGSLYGAMSDLPKSLEYHIKALALRKEINNKRGIAYSLNNIAEIYRLQGNFSTAIDYLNQSKQICNEIDDKAGIASSYTNLGLTYKGLKQYYIAILNLHKALDLILNSEIKERLVYILQNLGETYFEMGKMEESKKYYLWSYNEAKNIGHLNMQDNACLYLGKIEAINRHYPQAYSFINEHAQLQDSLFNIEKQKQLTEIEIRYETEKKDHQIILLNEQAHIQQLQLAKRNQWIIFIAVFTILLTIIFALLYWFRAFKNKQLLLQAILETENTERLRIAKDMHDELGSGFSKIQLFSEIARQNITNLPVLEENIGRISKSTQEIANNMRDLIWTMNPENSTLDNLIARLREYCADFLDEFPVNYTLNFPDEIPQTAISQDVQRNIYLTLKEALNNAIKHAKAGYITIDVSITGQVLNVKVIDDGNGFDQALTSRKGNGLFNMEARIKKLNGDFEIVSHKAKGTQVSFSINTSKTKHITQK